MFRDGSRTLIASSIVRLELAPNTRNTPEEVAHFQALFEFIHIWIPIDEALIARASEMRTAFDVASLDAVHLAAAELAVADQFVTTEKPGRPLFRATGIGPIFLGDL